jgi:Eukaryotic membrane protein family
MSLRLLTKAFVDQSPAVSRRMGLPTIPLACLTLRTMGQTIDIFRQAHFSSRGSESESSFGTESTLTPLDATLSRIVSLGTGGWEVWFLTNGLWIIIFTLGFLAILFLKLFIGIFLLKFARQRMKGMAVREEKDRQWDEGGRKVLNVGKGTRGGIEVEDRVRGMLDRGEDDLLGLGGIEGKGLLKVERYSMVSKRIW